MGKIKLLGDGAVILLDAQGKLILYDISSKQSSVLLPPTGAECFEITSKGFTTLVPPPKKYKSLEQITMELKLWEFPAPLDTGADLPIRTS